MTFNPNPTPTVNTTITTSLGIFNAYSIPPYSPPDAKFDYLIPSYPYRVVEGQTNGQVANLPGNYSYPYVSSYILRTKKWAIKRRATQISNGIVKSITQLETNFWQTSTIDGSEPQPTNLAILPPNYQNSEYAFDYFIGETYEIPETISEVPITVECFASTQTSNSYSLVDLPKPQISDYFNGYFLDPISYILNIDTTINLSLSGSILIHYYFKEDEMQIDSDGVSHPTISIQTWDLEIVANRSFRLKFTCVPCSISLEGDQNICDQIKAQVNNSNSLCFPEDLPLVKARWLSLYESRKNLLESTTGFYQSIDLDPTPYLWAASERWGQPTVQDLNTGLGIGENVSDAFVFNKYFKSNSDGTYGESMADSALLKLIGASINAQKWGVNPVDSTVQRVDDLGWRINRICDVAGIRVKPDGTIDKDQQKKLVRQIIDKNKNIDDKKIGVISFGELGMVVKRISNRFKKKGKNAEIVSDQCVIVQDIPQLMQEYFDQINLALGIQESSAIEIKQGDKGETVARFNNQLEILIELVNLLSSSNEMTRSSLVSSLVTQSQTNELIAGLGLPSVTKTIPIKINDKTHQVPFKGIAAHRSISQEVATCTYNVGIVLGQLL